MGVGCPGKSRDHETERREKGNTKMQQRKWSLVITTPGDAQPLSGFTATVNQRQRESVARDGACARLAAVLPLRRMGLGLECRADCGLGLAGYIHPPSLARTKGRQASIKCLLP